MNVVGRANGLHFVIDEVNYAEFARQNNGLGHTWDSQRPFSAVRNDI